LLLDPSEFRTYIGISFYYDLTKMNWNEAQFELAYPSKKGVN
jgi:hypothetical protein